MRKFFSIKEVADMTGYSEEGIRQFVRAGKLIAYRHSKNSAFRFQFSDIEAFIKTVKYVPKKQRRPVTRKAE